MQKNSNVHFNNLSHKIFIPSDVSRPYQDQLCKRLCTSFIGMVSKGHNGLKNPISLWEISDLVIFALLGENVVFGEFEHIAVSLNNQTQHLSNKRLRFVPDPVSPAFLPSCQWLMSPPLSGGGGIGGLGAHELLFVIIAPCWGNGTW